MKQNFYLPRHRIDSAQIRTFVKITPMASERKIFDIIAAAVLTGDNVFDLMRCHAMLLAKPAVLATISGPLADKQPGSGIHR
jgi:hypothetical protein